MADESKSLLGLLNGLTRRDYYGEDEMTDAYLKENLFPDMPMSEFEVLTHKAINMIKSMASTDMDLSQLDAFLTSQTKKKEGGITEEQSKVYAKFWKNHRVKIHDSIVARSQWSNTLKNISWRIDVETKSRHLDQINAPTAIVELHLADASSKQKKDEVVRFEMDEGSIKKVVHSLQDIEQQIAAHVAL